MKRILTTSCAICAAAAAFIGICGPIWMDTIWPTGPKDGFDEIAIPLFRGAWGMTLVLMAILLGVMHTLAGGIRPRALLWPSALLVCTTCLFWTHCQLRALNFYHYLGHQVFDQCTSLYARIGFWFFVACTTLGLSVLVHEAICLMTRERISQQRR